jgi:ATP-dependent exoDNAse (exonuclease V) beta subunit
VHYAIRHWLFPDSPSVAGRLQTLALEAGLADPAQRLEAVRLAELLLKRLQTNPLWREIDLAGERYHEVPYARLTGSSRLVTGYMDLLYRGTGMWQVVDFKTDSLRSLSERQYAVEQHRQQMRRYAQAAVDLLRAPVQVRLCFLDDQGKISLQEIPG